MLGAFLCTSQESQTGAALAVGLANGGFVRRRRVLPFRHGPMVDQTRWSVEPPMAGFAVPGGGLLFVVSVVSPCDREPSLRTLAVQIGVVAAIVVFEIVDSLETRAGEIGPTEESR